ncbi:MAG: YkvA family protein [Eubacteriales bacterium]
MKIMKILKNAKHIFQFFHDKNVPLIKKFIMLFGLAYFIFPLDIIPEFPVFGIGLIDDAAVMIAILNYLAEYLDKYNHKEPSKDRSQYIKDIDYKIDDE